MLRVLYYYCVSVILKFLFLVIGVQNKHFSQPTNQITRLSWVLCSTLSAVLEKEFLLPCIVLFYMLIPCCISCPEIYWFVYLIAPILYWVLLCRLYQVHKIPAIQFLFVHNRGNLTVTQPQANQGLWYSAVWLLSGGLTFY